MAKCTMNFKELLHYLPQRPPFLLIDRVLDIEPMKSIVAIKNVTNNEPFFMGHFPYEPVMPGVLILEALAQASVVLAYASAKENPEIAPMYYFAGIDNARFKRIVQPGDQLRLDIEITKIRKFLLKVHGIASVDGDVVCTADLMSMRKEQ